MKRLRVYVSVAVNDFFDMRTVAYAVKSKFLLKTLHLHPLPSVLENEKILINVLFLPKS